MPNYNGEKYIEEAIISILNQSYTHFEFIILDDCSTDNSFEIISKYSKKDSRIKAIKNSKNLGISRNRNKLFSLVSKESKYIAILDSDDIAMPKRIEKQVQFLQQYPSIKIIGSNVYIIDEKSKVIGKREYSKYPQKVKLLQNPFAQSAIMIKASVVREIGNYSLNYPVCEDWEYWMRVLKKYNGATLQYFGIKYRISTQQTKTTHLKPTITNGLKIKLKFLTLKECIKNPMIIIRIIIESILLLLPSKLILELFKKITYKKVNSKQ